jgi:hypothetical protein
VQAQAAGAGDRPPAGTAEEEDIGQRDGQPLALHGNPARSVPQGRCRSKSFPAHPAVFRGHSQAKKTSSDRNSPTIGRLIGQKPSIILLLPSQQLLKAHVFKALT